jgi:hypothetical protein
MDINREGQTSYTTRLQEAFLKNVTNDSCDKHLLAVVITPESGTKQQSPTIHNGLRMLTIIL